MKYPRLMLAGTGGDCGKTLVSLGLAAAWRTEGIPVAPFKKGPDYIDPAWLTLAAGRAARNLDTWMAGEDRVFLSFTEHALPYGINLIEANRGLHDGEDARGSHSSAVLSRLLKTPVVLILPAVKVTRTVAAIALGVKSLDRQVEIAGVVLNRLATSRQESIIREAIQNETGLPVLGAIPRMGEDLLPSRHLGLVTPEEHLQARKVIEGAAGIVSRSLEMDRLKEIAEGAVALEASRPAETAGQSPAAGLRIGVFGSSAFTFYYPENLEAIDRCGATRVSIDPLLDRELPEIDALYIGGGFPDTHAASLAANDGMRRSVRQAVKEGLPVWAECGGLMFLSRTVNWQGNSYPMAGVFPVNVVLGKSPAGHGYEEVSVDHANPFLAPGTMLRGHEFHYSRIEGERPVETIFAVRRGTGIGEARDGMLVDNALASYLHIHSLGTPQWIQGLVAAARKFNLSRC